jgi:GldM C-terminal domain
MLYLPLLKRLFFFVLLETFLQYSYGQPKLINKELMNKDTSLLFYGIENMLELTNTKYTKGLSINADNSTVSPPKNSSVFMVTPHRLGLDTVSVYYHKNLLVRKVFNVVPFPKPIARLGTSNDSLATIAFLLAQNGLTIFTNIATTRAFVVYGFTMKFTSNKLTKDKKELKILGNRFTAEAIEIIKALQPNDKIVFDNIKFGGCLRPLDYSFTITIR